MVYSLNPTRNLFCHLTAWSGCLFSAKYTLLQYFSVVQFVSSASVEGTVKGTECHSVLATWLSSIVRTQVHAWIPTGSVSISGRCPTGCIQTHGKAFIDITQSFEDAVRCTISAIFFLACSSLATSWLPVHWASLKRTHTHTHTHAV